MVKNEYAKSRITCNANINSNVGDYYNGNYGVFKMTKNEFIERWNGLQILVEQRVASTNYIFTCNRIEEISYRALSNYNLFAPDYWTTIVFNGAFGEYDSAKGNELRLLFLEVWYNYVLSEKAYLEF